MRRVILSDRSGRDIHRVHHRLCKEIPQCPSIPHAGKYEVVINFVNDVLIIPCRTELQQERKEALMTKMRFQPLLLF